MNFILTDLQSTVLELFRRVFYDTEGFRYTEKGMQCYKLYLYMYFGGYVRELDLPYIFCDEKSIHKMSARKTEEMFHGRMIDWVKSGELKRVAEDSYMLTDDGLKKLYDHVKRENSTGFQEISFNSFKESYSRKLINASYISNIGITVLKLSEMIETVFWYAPMLDYEGNMLTNNLDEFRNHCRVGSVGCLPPSEDIEITQTDTINTVNAVKIFCKYLIDIFCHRVRTERSADGILPHRNRSAISVSRTAGGVDKTFHFRFNCGKKHIYETGNIYLCRRRRIIY